MNEKILFCNETEINDKNFKSMIFYRRFFCHKYITILKLAMCIFIISSTIILDMHTIDKIFCLFMSILGIRNTLQVKECMTESNAILKYKFFEECFEVTDNKDTIINFTYESIKYIIDTRNYYYLVILKSIIVISKDGFIIGDDKQIKNFIKCKAKQQKAMI